MSPAKKLKYRISCGDQKQSSRSTPPQDSRRVFEQTDWWKDRRRLSQSAGNKQLRSHRDHSSQTRSPHSHLNKRTSFPVRGSTKRRIKRSFCDSQLLHFFISARSSVCFSSAIFPKQSLFTGGIFYDGAISRVLFYLAKKLLFDAALSWQVVRLASRVAGSALVVAPSQRRRAAGILD